MSIDELKSKVICTIEQNKKRIIDVADAIYTRPELGYKEIYASRLIADQLASLGLEVERDIAVTGCKARAHGTNERPSIAVLGELDAVICKDHPDAGNGGCVHACGHSNQIAAMLGAAIGLVASGVIEQLDGTVSFSQYRRRNT